MAVFIDERDISSERAIKGSFWLIRVQRELFPLSGDRREGRVMDNLNVH